MDVFEAVASRYSCRRMRQLAAIEKSLDDADFYRGMERQRVTEALVAATRAFSSHFKLLKTTQMASSDSRYASYVLP